MEHVRQLAASVHENAPPSQAHAAEPSHPASNDAATSARSAHGEVWVSPCPQATSIDEWNRAASAS
ncbi:MAG: hypothetical protein K1X94_02580 [Sandaracinaceae bacterium]|nr:hypothetical protein [Sandaracinaceae bacterium]